MPCASARANTESWRCDPGRGAVAHGAAVGPPAFATAARSAPVARALPAPTPLVAAARASVEEELEVGPARGQGDQGRAYRQAGLTVARTLFAEPYLSTDTAHEGLLLHTVYHRPNGWDHVPSGRKVPCGESAMWGDYHARELALLVQREAAGGPYLKFFLD